jgi:hypothetical protein
VFSASNVYRGQDTSRSNHDGRGSTVWLVDLQHGPPLHDLYSGIGERGEREALLDLVAGVVPGLVLIEVHTDQGDPRLNLTFADGSVPVAMAGDGIRALVRMSLELYAHPEGAGTVLLEEPEAYQHPAAIRASGRAIVEAVRRGIQVILTTHSLELIDALLDHLKPDELDQLSLHRLVLDEGSLRTSRLSGSEVRLARGDIEEDLR